ncbi:Regulatory protein, TetR [Cupriavidus necator]|uniref:Regulatory protein, TetR n=1 Tax=Cupriavidus necator TaxID=106590 RepID=A0A1K0JU27_CUPNE|nr:Regulatory protein, TetR [Cupriavidus necator]
MSAQKSLEQLDGHAGFVPPRYARGKRTADALLDSGRKLLRTHSLDGMTIEDLCAGANVTTGAFYRRFESKDAFFKALQSLAMEDATVGNRALLAELDSREWALGEGIALLVRNSRLWYCLHEGVIRASQMQRSRDARSWEPIKQLGIAYVEQMAPRVERMRGVPPWPDLPLRIRFGFQMMFGTLVNAVANNPGPLELTSPMLDVELARSFCAYLCAAPG